MLHSCFGVALSNRQFPAIGNENAVPSGNKTWILLSAKNAFLSVKVFMPFAPYRFHVLFRYLLRLAQFLYLHAF